MSEAEKIKKLIRLDKQNKGSVNVSATEREVIEIEQRFEAVYYSNKLEGNKLSKAEARRAILTK